MGIRDAKGLSAAHPGRNDFASFTQVSTAELPQYREYLDPLLPGAGAGKIHTSAFKDGRRIPTLAELLEEVPDQALPAPLHARLGVSTCTHCIGFQTIPRGRKISELHARHALSRGCGRAFWPQRSEEKTLRSYYTTGGP